MLDIGVGAFEIEGPAVVSADEVHPAAPRVAHARGRVDQLAAPVRADIVEGADLCGRGTHDDHRIVHDVVGDVIARLGDILHAPGLQPDLAPQLVARSEEHTSELQSLMRISYAVFCLKKKTRNSDKANITVQISHRTLNSSCATH